MNIYKEQGWDPDRQPQHYHKEKEQHHSNPNYHPNHGDGRSWGQTKHGYLLQRLEELSDSHFGRSLWRSETLTDAWLIAAAAQVGQQLLILPQSMSQMGYGWGSFFIVLYALLGCWTVYLLTWLYFEYEARYAKQNVHHMHEHKHRVQQYHEMVRDIAGRVIGNFTLVINMTYLTFTAILQLVGSASNLYYLNSNMNKRQWQFVVGTLALFSVLIPSYKHFRAAAFVGILSISITATYLIAAPRIDGQSGEAHQGPKNPVKFFTGATNVLFAFGGRGITVEILEAMEYGERFKYVYGAVILYWLILTIASSTSVYWAYGDRLLGASNVFAVLPSSIWRNLAIFSMFVHQSIAFIIFIYPVFLVVEKLFKVHEKQFGLRILARLPVVLLAWFVALAVPFFGPVNAVVGAFVASLSVYLIPPLTFYLAFRDKEAQKHCAMDFPRWLPSWPFLHFINAVVMLWILVVGCVIGAWVSITNLVADVHTFGFFQKCYQC